MAGTQKKKHENATKSQFRTSPDLGGEHPLRRAGFLHESDILGVMIRVKDSTWLVKYRTKIPGHTDIESGRWFHSDDFVAFFRQHLAKIHVEETDDSENQT